MHESFPKHFRMEVLIFCHSQTARMTEDEQKRVKIEIGKVNTKIKSHRPIIIIKKDWQCKAGRGSVTPYQSEDPSPTLPT